MPRLGEQRRSPWFRRHGLPCIASLADREAGRGKTRGRDRRGCCTSTSTSSSRPSRCCGGRSCAASRSWSAATATRPSAASSRPRPTRPARSACTPGCRCARRPRRCPDCVFLPVDRAAYEAASDAVMTALRSLGAVTEVMGWDEAFLAVETDDPEGFARRMQEHGSRRRPSWTARSASARTSSRPSSPRLRQAGRGVPADPPDLVRAARRRAGQRAVGRRRQDRRQAGGAGHRHGRRPGDAPISRRSPGGSGRRSGRGWCRPPAAWIGSQVSAEPYLPRSRSREVTFQEDIEDWDRVRAEVARAGRPGHADVSAEDRPAVRVVVKVRYRPFFTSTHGVPLRRADGDAGRDRAGRAGCAGAVHRPHGRCGCSASGPSSPPS